MRVLLANEPRAYREALVGALWELRPAIEVIEIPPEALAEAVERLRRMPRVLTPATFLLCRSVT